MAASFAAASAAAGTPTVDMAALQAWVAHTDGRLDSADTAITGVGLQLAATVEGAKVALQQIVEGVRVELMGFKRQVHSDHGTMNAVIAQLSSSSPRSK